MAVKDKRFCEVLEEFRSRDSRRAEALYDGVTYSLVLLGLRLDEIEGLPMRHIWRYLEISKRLQESLGFCWPPQEPRWDVSIMNPPPRSSRP